MDTLIKDLRYALRMLWKNPAFTSVAVLSLALGIGANATVFCWIQSVLLRSVPGAARPERLVALTTLHGSAMWDTVSFPDIKDYAGLTNVFAGIIGSQITPACLTMDGHPEWIYGQIATANFFDVLGVKPYAGELFRPEYDLRPGGAPVVVLSYGFWHRRFAGDTAILGKTVDLNRSIFTVVGVAPPGFHGTMGGLICDFWAPVAMHKQVANFGSLTSRGDRWLHTQARLASGVTIREAQAAVNLTAKQLEQSYPDLNKDISLRVLPLWKAPYGGQAVFLPVLRLLMAVSMGVLLIVAANVANLLLARATGRQKEIAVRLAMGASRTRLIRQLLTESVVLSVFGGVLGIVFASLAANLLLGFMPNTYLPIGYTFELDGRTLGFTLLVALATGIVFGLAPALQASKPNLGQTLKEGGRQSGGGTPHHRLRSALVVSEIALALLLLVGAGLCIKGFERAHKIDAGFDPRQVLVAGLRVGMHGYTEETATGLYRQLEARLAATPGVQAVGLFSWLPLGFEGGPSATLDILGYNRGPSEDVTIPYSIISPGYFKTLRIPVVAGREFTDRDDRSAPSAAIINEIMARKYWPGQNPLGRTFKLWGGAQEAKVVGIAKAGKYRSLNEPPKAFFYLPYQQAVWNLNLGVAVRVQGQPAGFAAALNREIHALDPRVEVWALLPMTDFIEAAFVTQRITSTLLVVLGLVACLLAAIGIYGVMAYVVTQRTQEFGIRMALGARRLDVHHLVLSEGMKLALLGVGVGLAGATALTHLLTSFLYGVSPFDPVTLLGVSALLGVVTLISCLLPALRATRVNPMEALRYE